MRQMIQNIIVFFKITVEICLLIHLFACAWMTNAGNSKSEYVKMFYSYRAREYEVRLGLGLKPAFASAYSHYVLTK